MASKYVVINGLTEARIERLVEIMTDATDALLMRGIVSQREYDLEMFDIGAWADCAYARAREKVAPHPLVAAAIAQRKTAGLGVRIVFNDGSPDFTGYYNDAAKRDRVIAAARVLANVERAEVIVA